MFGTHKRTKHCERFNTGLDAQDRYVCQAIQRSAVISTLHVEVGRYVESFLYQWEDNCDISDLLSSTVHTVTSEIFSDPSIDNRRLMYCIERMIFPGRSSDLNTSRPLLIDWV